MRCRRNRQTCGEPSRNTEFCEVCLADIAHMMLAAKREPDENGSVWINRTRLMALFDGSVEKMAKWYKPLLED